MASANLLVQSKLVIIIRIISTSHTIVHVKIKQTIYMHSLPGRPVEKIGSTVSMCVCVYVCVCVCVCVCVKEKEIRSG